ncbi:MAG: hypothetical protein ACM3S0_08070 [Acidobacteriota bacterium]
MANELRFAGNPEAAREADFVARARAALRLPEDAQLQLKDAHQDTQGGHHVEYQVTLPVEIKGEEFGPANGVTVDEPVTASLQFDPKGALASSQVSAIDQRHLQLVKDQIKKLAAAGEIAPPSADRPSRGALSLAEGTDANRKQWRVETDAQGRKRLKRAFIA